MGFKIADGRVGGGDVRTSRCTGVLAVWTSVRPWSTTPTFGPARRRDGSNIEGAFMSGSRAGGTRFAIRNNARIAYDPGISLAVDDEAAAVIVVLHDLLAGVVRHSCPNGRFWPLKPV